MTEPGQRHARAVSAHQLAGAVQAHLDDGHQVALVACHEDADAFRIVYVLLRARDDDRSELVLTVPRDAPEVPSLARLDYSLGRFERETRDLYGVRPLDHPLPRRLVRHGHWPKRYYPMLRNATPHPAFDQDLGSFPFIEVEGDGVYEIPVGPVHAGLIEPGHFRFSVVGETILRMKARLWFVHRGIEKLLEGAGPATAIQVAERISGDTAVGHSLALTLAIEEAAGVAVTDDDRATRALLLELERVHNHVADIGALANDVGFGLVNAHALRLREELLRINQATTGHRLLRGAIRVGGAHVIELPEPERLRSIAASVAELSAITIGNATVRDRFVGTSILAQDQARRLGVLGYVARASGIDIDARRDHPIADLGEPFRVTLESGGDVMSRYAVRVREVEVSTAVIAHLTQRLGGRTGEAYPTAAFGPGSGLGIVEGWRGRIAHRVELDASGHIARAKIVDPSFFNWPALPVALADTIVPDFPLTNKSFNQSYAGNDL
ncbi:MAG: hydrogenase large subunit [Candidatus Nanopelagicales bacterium]